MILYLDTSGVVKLFVDEAHSALVRDAVAASSVVATHMIGYVEACSAFARLAERKKDKSIFMRFRRALDKHWPDWHIVAVDERLMRRAGDLAAFHRLRGFDGVHLAAAEAVFGVSRELDFQFAVFDKQLARAAKLIGLPLLEP